MNRAADAVEMFVAEGIEAVMNRFNADPESDRREELPEEDSGST